MLLSIRARFDNMDASPQLFYEEDHVVVDDATFGTDIVGTGKPQIVLSTWSGGTCCGGFVLVEVGDTLRELLNLQLGRGSAGLTPIPGSRYSAIRVDDHWPSARCNACGARPVIYLRYDGSRLVADPELMRQPAPFRPHLESDAHRNREGHERDGTESFEEEVTSTVVDLIYTGNLESACAFLSLAWPDDWKAEMDGQRRRAFFDSLLAKFPTDSDGTYPGLGQALAKLNGVSPSEALRCS